VASGEPSGVPEIVGARRYVQDRRAAAPASLDEVFGGSAVGTQHADAAVARQDERMLAAGHALVDALIARGITDPDDVEAEALLTPTRRSRLQPHPGDAAHRRQRHHDHPPRRHHRRRDRRTATQPRVPQTPHHDHHNPRRRPLHHPARQRPHPPHRPPHPSTTAPATKTRARPAHQRQRLPRLPQPRRRSRRHRTTEEETTTGTPITASRDHGTSCAERRSSAMSASAGLVSGRVAEVARVTLHVGCSPVTGRTTRSASSGIALAGR